MVTSPKNGLTSAQAPGRGYGKRFEPWPGPAAPHRPRCDPPAPPHRGTRSRERFRKRASETLPAVCGWPRECPPAARARGRNRRPRAALGAPPALGTTSNSHEPIGVSAMPAVPRARRLPRDPKACGPAAAAPPNRSGDQPRKEPPPESSGRARATLRHGRNGGQASRQISTGQLKPSPVLHLLPIDPVVFRVPSVCLAAKGDLVFRGGWRLDAFSASPFAT